MLSTILFVGVLSQPPQPAQIRITHAECWPCLAPLLKGEPPTGRATVPLILPTRGEGAPATSALNTRRNALKRFYVAIVWRSVLCDMGSTCVAPMSLLYSRRRG